MNYLNLIGREEPLFDKDVSTNNYELEKIVSSSSFLVIGGAGSIGQAVTKEIFKRNPRILHVVDISENNMVELVRELRSTEGYISGDFKTFAIDCGSSEFNNFACSESYDYVFNLSALKHVRSEKDPYTLMRMINVNIFNTVKTLQQTKNMGSKKYFCVSTDKAANPVNMMGASKKIMEIFLMKESLSHEISMARFANVAFSDGSLLHGFNQRFSKKQPLSAPIDVKRYFLTPQESGELCLLSGIFGDNRDIFFPKLNEKLHLITFSEIAEKYIISHGYEPYICESEDEARLKIKELLKNKKWPCYFFQSDTTGEKDFEEFYTESEILNMEKFTSIGIIKNEAMFNDRLVKKFSSDIKDLYNKKNWNKNDIVKIFNEILPEFQHLETGKYLDQRM